MQPIHVLIVDDDPMILKVNRGYVEQVQGFRVIGTARSGDVALAAVSRLKPDLVLLDVYMPDQDGLTFLREMRARSIPSDVIMVSAAHDAQTIQEALRHGAHDYVIKPFSFERLQAALESYRGMKGRLASGAQLSQAEFDRLRRAPIFAAGDETPKGLNDWTLRQVVNFLGENQEPPTSGDVASRLGISRVTARRYLEHLARLGKVQVELQYGAPGRPVNRYILVKP